MPFIEERIRQIESRYAHLIRNLLVLHLTDETFRLVLMMNGGTRLRVAERWRSGALVRYSYYWLDAENKVKVGWDNAPHHTQLENFPHHKHIGEQSIRVPSYEVCLEDENHSFTCLLTHLLLRWLLPVDGQRFPHRIMNHADVGHTVSPSLTLSLK
ncbi:MAG: hypothetical protein HY731_04245 [Candidatus Tectomicrobia bacterium]|nr:hypothetical protein [Candidatus Tectomicrobia bacterium]